MFTWFKIAFRNLKKNQRRSAFTVLAIGLGYASVCIFGGFTNYVFHNIKESVIYTSGTGHISIFREGFNASDQDETSQFLIGADEYQKTLEIIETIDSVNIISSELNINGLASNGEFSTIFIAEGSIPSRLQAIRESASGFLSTAADGEGRLLIDTEPTWASLSRGLAKKLGLGFGDNVIVTAPTVDGYINALDVEIVKQFETGAPFLDNKYIELHLELAQELYGTEGVDRINLLLNSEADVAEALAQLRQRFKTEQLALEVFDWETLSAFYRQVREMFSIIFLFIFVIVFVIAAMSVINTVNMAVLERTREIGTLRAIGATRGKVIALFTTESALLALLGLAFGLSITLAAASGVSIAELTWVPPPFSKRIPLEINIVPWQLLGSALVFLVLCVVAAWPPTHRAVRGGIVSALGHA